MALFTSHKTQIPTADEALPGRETAMRLSGRHFVNGASINAPFPAGIEQAVFGLGCFWGAERKFWQQPGRVHDGGRVRGRPHARTPPTKKCAPAGRVTPKSCWSSSIRA